MTVNVVLLLSSRPSIASIVKLITNPANFESYRKVNSCLVLLKLHQQPWVVCTFKVRFLVPPLCLSDQVSSGIWNRVTPQRVTVTFKVCFCVLGGVFGSSKQSPDSKMLRSSIVMRGKIDVARFELMVVSPVA